MGERQEGKRTGKNCEERLARPVTNQSSHEVRALQVGTVYPGPAKLKPKVFMTDYI